MSTMRTSPTSTNVTILAQGMSTVVPAKLEMDENLWVTLNDLTKATRWEVKPEGVCQDELCIMVPDGAKSSLLREEGGDNWFNLTEFARYLGRPYAKDDSHNVWSFGSMTEVVEDSMSDMMAPDFTLPDLDGNLYSLSSYRGKKVVLACWASW